MIVDSLDREFAFLIESLKELVRTVDADQLYRHVGDTSFGEQILRSAAVIEQTLGGLTSNLWDDPFEWTLPEALSTGDLILEYLNEAEETRKKGFAFFRSDEDLRREIPAPERLKSIFQILLETTARAEHFQGRAFAVFQMFSDEKLPRLF